MTNSTRSLTQSKNSESTSSPDHIVHLDFGPEYTFDLEFLWFGVLLHSTVRVPFTKHVLSKYRQDVALVAQTLSLPVYVFQAPSHDPKKRKFIQRLGFRFHHLRVTEDGEKAEMWTYRPLD